MRIYSNLIFIAVLVALTWAQPRAKAADTNCFIIQVVDEKTGRGVPLVELATVNKVSYWTDSAGLVAFNEPGLMNQIVFFYVRSHGYEYPADIYGYRGKTLKITPGGKAVLTLKRLNIAERLYRVTGQGIYRDSTLAGYPCPIKEPLLNGQVSGQDAVMATPYRDQIYWFWGDTDWTSYAVGNFATAGATSVLPANGGLDPAVGVDLTYFIATNGFSRPMCDFPPNGPKWLSGLLTVNDALGRERLVGVCDTHKTVDEVIDRSFVVFNDQTTNFQRLATIPPDAVLFPDTHPFRVNVKGEDFYYFPSWTPQPAVRVRAKLTSVTNLDEYESFSCLLPETRTTTNSTPFDRTPEGLLNYTWKRNTAFVGQNQQEALIASRRIRPDEGWLQMRDYLTGSPVRGRGGSVNWNPFRHRWVMITQGEPGSIWFAEADTPVGPWVYARQIVGHDQYNFYNPSQHRFFDQQNGKQIYFEATYSAAFSGASTPTPRYDYNQIMYRLDMADTRLALPAPVYRLKGKQNQFFMREGIESEQAWDQIEEVGWFAIPLAHRAEGLIPVYAVEGPTGEMLQTNPTAKPGEKPVVLFYALPLIRMPSDPAPIDLAILYEFRTAPDTAPLYSTKPNAAGPGKVGKQICRVWRNPMSMLVLDRAAKPAKKL